MKLSGFLNIDKPRGLTSFQVVKRIRQIVKAKVGHLGTLDPIATGVLILTIGSATRLTSLFIEKDKEYEFSVKFGIATDTLDSEGKVIERVSTVSVSEQEVQDIIPKFLGTIKQIPPQYSAIKYKGQKLYEYARQSKHIDMEKFARIITIYKLKLLELDGTVAKFYVKCSSGTYIRSLARDIGLYLGLPAYVMELRRLAVGDAEWGKIDNAVKLELLDSIEKVNQHIVSLPVILKDFTKIELNDNDIFHLKKGRYLPFFKELPGPPPFVITTKQGEIVGLGSVVDNHIHLDRML